MAKREYQIVTNHSIVFLVVQRTMAWYYARYSNDYLSVICFFPFRIPWAGQLEVPTEKSHLQQRRGWLRKRQDSSAICGRWEKPFIYASAAGLGH